MKIQSQSRTHKVAAARPSSVRSPKPPKPAKHPVKLDSFEAPSRAGRPQLSTGAGSTAAVAGGASVPVGSADIRALLTQLLQALQPLLESAAAGQAGGASGAAASGAAGATGAAPTGGQATKLGPVPLEGFDAGKLADPSHTSVKYLFGRVATNYPLDSVKDKASAEALLNKMVPDLQAAGLKVKGVKGDKLLLETPLGLEAIDVVRGSGSGNPGWWWGADGKVASPQEIASFPPLAAPVEPRKTALPD